MKPVVVLMLAAFVLMWGGVLLDIGRPPATSRARGTDPGAPASALAAERNDEPGGPAAAEDAVPADAPPAASDEQDQRRARDQEAPRMGRSERVADPTSKPGTPAPTRRPDAKPEPNPDELIGELGQGAGSPEFVKLETDYASEPRDGLWARAEEQRMSMLIRAHPISQQLALLNCQESVCRIMLETQSKDAFAQLLAVPGLTEATGLSRDSPYSHRTGQLSVYYRRAEDKPAR